MSDAVLASQVPACGTPVAHDAAANARRTVIPLWIGVIFNLPDVFVREGWVSVQFVAVSMIHVTAGSNRRVAPVCGGRVSAIRTRIIHKSQLSRGGGS